MEKLTINRKEWLRGEGDIASVLCRSLDNKKCCLGIALISGGVPEEYLIDMASPVDIRPLDMPDIYYWLLEEEEEEIDTLINSSDTCRLMDINDDVTISDNEREALIIGIFAMHDIDVNFVG